MAKPITQWAYNRFTSSGFAYQAKVGYKGGKTDFIEDKAKVGSFLKAVVALV